MTSVAFYEAFANVLVSHDLLHALRDHPETVRAKYALTEPELALLRSATPDALHLSQHMVRAKRAVALELLLPQTVRVLEEHDGGATLSRYVDDVLCRSDVDILRAVTHGHDFVRWLAEQPDERRPVGLIDLARFELAVADLGVDPAAAEAALRRVQAPDGPAGPIEADPRAYPMLAADVRVVLLHCDVLALPNPVHLSDLAARITEGHGLLLRKIWNVRSPACHRLGIASVELLRRCDGRTPVEDVVAAVVGADPAARARARHVVSRAAAESIVHLCPAEAGERSPNGEEASCEFAPL